MYEVLKELMADEFNDAEANERQEGRQLAVGMVKDPLWEQTEWGREEFNHE